jgi:hypothetical protein
LHAILSCACSIVILSTHYRACRADPGSLEELYSSPLYIPSQCGTDVLTAEGRGMILG